MEHTSSPSLPPDWDRILDNVSQSLTEALATLDAQAAGVPNPLEGTPSAGIAVELARFAQGLNTLEERLAHSERLVLEVDRALQEGQELLQRERSVSEGVRQRLAEQLGRAIG